MSWLSFIFIGPFRCLKAQWRAMQSGYERATVPEQASRLAKCSACDLRVEDRCGECWCYLPEKTTLKSESCPDNRW